MATTLRIDHEGTRLITEAGLSTLLPEGSVVTVQRVVGGQTEAAIQLPVDADVETSADVLDVAGAGGHRQAVEAFLQTLDPEVFQQAILAGGASTTPGRRAIDWLLGQAARL